MIRTAIVVLVLIGAVCFLPLWVQVLLCIVGLLAVRYYSALIIPAIVSDVLYAPTAHLTFSQMKLTILTSVVVALYWFVLHKTRIGEQYGWKT